jgi:hypothetical protein
MLLHQQIQPKPESDDQPYNKHNKFLNKQINSFMQVPNDNSWPISKRGETEILHCPELEKSLKLYSLQFLIVDGH